MKHDLPKCIAAYLSADEVKDAALLALCFSEGATVRDEQHSHHGREAITQWKQDSYKKYKYTAQVLDATTLTDSTKVHVLLTGNFPGSPIEVDYLFQLANEQISSLEIR
jgi:hypothetical protein